MALQISRRQQLNLTSLGGILVLIGALALLNLVAGWVFARWDWSDGKVYSLSAASKKLIRSLEDPVLVKVFFSPQLPAPYSTQTAYVRDLLGEYRTYSRGQVHPEFIRTDDEEKFRREALSAGMMPVRFTSVASDQLQVKEGFMGLALYYGDKKEVIPVLKETTGIEYDFTSTIHRLTTLQKKTLGFTSGHGERSLTGEQGEFRAVLSQLYEVKEMDLQAKPTAQAEVTALCVLGPKERWDEKSLYALDQWIMRGIPAAFFLDKYTVDLQMFWARPVTTDLDPLLAHYGVTVENDLVFDHQCQRVSLSSRQGQFNMTAIMDYPLLPLVNHFSRSHPAVRGLEVVAFPFVAALSPATTGQAAMTFEALAQSSNHSWRQTPSYVHPYQLPAPGPSAPKGPFTVAAAVTGRLTSHFAGKPAPVEMPFPRRDAAAQGRLVVVGTSALIDPNLPLSPGNGAFLLNLIDWLAQDEALIGIRAKGVAYRPLKELSAPTRLAVKWGTILGMPLLVVVGGLWRWRQRRRWREQVALWYAS